MHYGTFILKTQYKLSVMESLLVSTIYTWINEGCVIQVNKVSKILWQSFKLLLSHCFYVTIWKCIVIFMCQVQVRGIDSWIYWELTQCMCLLLLCKRRVSFLAFYGGCRHCQVPFVTLHIPLALLLSFFLTKENPIRRERWNCCTMPFDW